MAGFPPVLAYRLRDVIARSGLVEMLPARVSVGELERGIDLHRADAVVVGYRALGGPGALRQLAAHDRRVAVIVVTDEVDRALAGMLRACGAASVLALSDGREEFVTAVAAAARGMRDPGYVVRHDLVWRLAGKLSVSSLTVLELLLVGCSAAQIAFALNVPEDTVRTRRRRMYQKLGVHNRDELAECLERIVPLRPEPIAIERREVPLAFARLSAARTRPRWLRRGLAVI
jgi:DNA-binding NarL/FixJ family response regulator